MGGTHQLRGGGGGGFLDPLNIFGDEGFRIGGPQSFSTLSAEQQQLLQLLSDTARSNLTQATPQLDTLQRQLMQSNTAQARQLSERTFNEALLNPTMDAYNKQVAPRVNSEFAGIGGTLSSRRGDTLARGRTDVIRQAQASLAGILPTVQAFPLQQTLAQIQGLQGIQTQRYQPYQNALQFALQPTQQITQTPNGPGWGILSDVIGIL